MTRYPLILLVYYLLTISTSGHAALPNPKERIDFWQQNYTALTAAEDERVSQVQNIFARLIKSAGHRPGIEPRLFIIKENPHNISLPIAIPDGWIILSKKVLDICYQQSAHGDDRMAFVLGHEISHQLDDDFWHMKFFQAMESTGENDRKIATELQNIIKDSNRILAKELRADEAGIIYSMMAGYNVYAIVNTQAEDNFFYQWVNNVDPDRLADNEITTNTHPTAKQRTLAVRTRLQQVAEKSDLFNLGIWFYQAGDYQHAQIAFDTFRQYYPGREVYHNLASSHHQLALQYYVPEQQESFQIPFQLAISIDPLNRANRLTYRSRSETSQRFSQHIQAAIENYQKAISLDPEYLVAYTNLASAYLLLKEPYKAIAVLQDAEKLSPSDPVLINTMGVAFFLANNNDKAKQYLGRLQNKTSPYAPAIFNLGVIASRNKNQEDARRYWDEYMRIDDQSAWAQRLRQYLHIDTEITSKQNNPREKLTGIEVGTFNEEVPASWHALHQKVFKLTQTPHRLTEYDNGILTLSEANEIRILITKPDFRGSSARGIRIGQRMEEVINVYGPADSMESTTLGKTLSYYAAGISFQIQNQRVAGWILYFD